MKVETVIIFLLVVVQYTDLLELPPNFQKCDKKDPSFNKCLSDAISAALKQLYKPLHEYGLPSIEPLKLGNLNFKHGNKSNGLQTKYTNGFGYGFTEILEIEARMNIEYNILRIKTTFSKIRIEVDYEAEGTILLLPINITSKAIFTLIKPKCRNIFSLEEYEKTNQKYFKVLNDQLNLEVEGLIIEYKNLFKSKDLTNKFNAEMSKNWKQIMSKISRKHYLFWEKLFGGILNNFLERVSISELFK